MTANMVVLVFGVSNIALLLLVFTLMARPYYLLPVLKRWLGEGEASEELLLGLASKLRWLSLGLLFCWSFCCSTVIVYAKIFLS